MHVKSRPHQPYENAPSHARIQKPILLFIRRILLMSLCATTFRGLSLFTTIIILLQTLCTTLSFVAVRYSPHAVGRSGSSSSTITTAGAVNLDDIETKAQSAAETWDIHVTSFVTPTESLEIETRLGKRADVECIRMGGGVSSSPPTRSRFLFTNPDMGLTAESAESDYCTVLCIDNVGLSEMDPWPNVLQSIGVDVERVGDIFESSNSNTAYLVVDPDVEKTCVRLLPKELPGTGVTVSTLQDGETIPEDATLVEDMEIKRIDKREQKQRKK